MPGVRYDDGYDEQDGAEAFDEANLDDRDGVAEMRTFEEMPDLFDATSAVGDRDDDEGRALDASDFDEDEFDEDDLEEDDELDYHAAADDREEEADGFDEDQIEPDSIDGLDEVGDADLVSGGEDDFTNFQARSLSDEDLRRMGYARADGPGGDPQAEKALDIGLEGTFPASDPVSATRPGR